MFLVGMTTNLLIIIRLNAIMLSRLRMSVKECLQEYPQLAKRTFGKKKQIGQRIVSGSKYDETPLIEEINRLVNQRTYHKPPRDKPPRGKYEYHMYPSPGDLCRTYVYNVLYFYETMRLLILIELLSLASTMVLLPSHFYFEHMTILHLKP